MYIVTFLLKLLQMFVSHNQDKQQKTNFDAIPAANFMRHIVGMILLQGNCFSMIGYLKEGSK